MYEPRETVPIPIPIPALAQMRAIEELAASRRQREPHRGILVIAKAAVAWGLARRTRSRIEREQPASS